MRPDGLLRLEPSANPTRSQIARFRSVGTNVGATPLARTPRDPNSSAAHFVMISSAAFEVAYGATKGAGLRTEADSMLTIDPPVPRSAMAVPISRVRISGAHMMTANCNPRS
jgi:hypothetical protein